MRPTNLVDNEKIGPRVAFSKASPAAFERMITIHVWQRITLDQQAEHNVDVFDVSAGTALFLVILLESREMVRGIHAPAVRTSTS